MKKRPYHQKSFAYEMGLSPLKIKDWFSIDSRWLVQIKEKQKLFGEIKDQVFQVTEEGREASEELLETLAQHLSEHFPDRFQKSKGKFYCLATGRSWDLARPKLHPLEVLAGWVREDICLMQEQEGDVRLVAAAVCFPSRWNLIDKINKNMAQIHSPVPGFNESLEPLATRFLKHMSEDKPMTRANWTLHASDRLFVPPPTKTHREREIQKERERFDRLTPEEIYKNVFFRSETQTFTRLPKTKVVVFTIRTDIESLESLFKEDGEKERFANCLRTMPKEVAQYKGMRGFYVPLLNSLRGTSLGPSQD